MMKSKISTKQRVTLSISAGTYYQAKTHTDNLSHLVDELLKGYFNEKEKVSNTTKEIEKEIEQMQKAVRDLSQELAMKTAHLSETKQKETEEKNKREKEMWRLQETMRLNNPARNP